MAAKQTTEAATQESQSSPTSSTSSFTPDNEASSDTDTHGVVNMDEEMAQIEKELEELEIQSASNDLNPIVDEESTTTDDKELELFAANDEPKDAKLDAQTAKESNSLANANMKVLMDSFIAQLPNCVNRELIDKAAKEFCVSLNTKLNRKRLTSAIFQVQRTRLDLLPFYARFVAILSPCMPELSADLSALILNDFRLDDFV